MTTSEMDEIAKRAEASRMTGDSSVYDREEALAESTLRLLEWARKAREVLAAVEWEGRGVGMPVDGVCPSCEGESARGHAPECELAALLK